MVPGTGSIVCLDRGEADVDAVVSDHVSLSGGVGWALTNDGGCGSDTGARGMNTGVSYGIREGGAVLGVVT